MLPDCPVIKSEVRDRLDSLFRAMVNRYLGVVAETPRSRIHEGKRNVIVRETGHEDETPMMEASTGYEIATKDIPNLSVEEVLQKLDVAAQDMAKQIASSFYKALSDAVEKTGNTVDGRGKGFTAETIFEVLEKIWIDFDENGSPKMPTLTIHPNQMEQVKRAFESIDADSVLDGKFKALIERKREEWIAREASRKLVG